MSRTYSTKRDMMAERHVPKWAREIIAGVAKKHDVTPNIIMLDFRHDKACIARREAIYRQSLDGSWDNALACLKADLSRALR